MAKNTKQVSVLYKGQTIEGKFSCKGILHINGTVKGLFNGEDVTVNQDGAIFADAEVDTLVVAGRFQGNLKASKVLHILPTGICTGKIECGDLVVERGGILNAEITSLKYLQLKSESDSSFSVGEDISDN